MYKTRQLLYLGKTESREKEKQLFYIALLHDPDVTSIDIAILM